MLFRSRFQVLQNENAARTSGVHSAGDQRRRQSPPPGPEGSEDLDLAGRPRMALGTDGDLADQSSPRRLDPMEATGGTDVIVPRSDPMQLIP